MKTHRSLLVSAIVCAALSLGANLMASTIAQLEALGSTVTPGQTLDSGPVVTAIMSQPGTFGGHTYTAWAVTAQDGTGSIDLYGSTGWGSYTPAAGDVLSAAGTWSPYHQIPELASMTSVTKTGTAAVPADPVTTIGHLNLSQTIDQNLQAYPVEIDNVSIYTDSAATIAASGNFAAANTTFYIKDTSGNIMEMYFWYTSYACDGKMVGNAIPTGNVDVVGLLSESPGFAVEITPYSFSPVPEPSLLALAGLGLAGLFISRRRIS